MSDRKTSGENNKVLNLRSAIFNIDLESIYVKVLGTPVVMKGQRAVHVKSTYTDVGHVYTVVNGKTYKYILDGLDKSGVQIAKLPDMIISVDFIPDIICTEMIAVRYTNEHGHLYDKIIVIEKFESEQLFLNYLTKYVNNIIESVYQFNDLINVHNDR
tara:strand:- start:1246 stop:1719 length:474 start_codon:yes stop_codon:yes gene_type:complete